MLPREQREAFARFYKSARRNDILDPKTTLLIHFASAMAVGCSPCMEQDLGMAKEEGITEDELGAAQSIAMLVAAGRIRAQLQEVRARQDESGS